MLKSDQNGIEIKNRYIVSPTIKKLKSDQNGIEIYFTTGLAHIVRVVVVKIRPKWD